MELKHSMKQNRSMKMKPCRECMKIMGRTTQTGDVLYLGFSSSYIEFETVASRIAATLCTDEKPMEESFLGCFAVYLDDAKEPALREALREPEQTFVLFEEEQPRRVKLRLVKMSEAAFGLVGVKEFEITDSADSTGCTHSAGAAQDKHDIIVTKTPDRPHRMELIGDSITCGYGNEGVLGRDVFTTAQENPEEAYAVLTANALNADYQLVSWSGIGLISNWVPEDVNEPREEMLVPWLYPYRDLRLCEKLGLPLEKWDDSQYRPELIVLHLGTNDDSYVRNIPDRMAVFGGAYYAFLEYVHEHQPQAAILCALGTMGQNLCGEVARQAERFAAEHPEVRIDSLVLPEQKEEDGIATDFHPSKITHKKAAQALTAKVREFMGWQGASCS